MESELNKLEFVITADGSKTIYNPAVGENYHSRHGALQESRHVFLNSGLRCFLDSSPTKHVSILEVGLGTGLNFLLTADFCTTEKIKLDYTGIEAYPISQDMIGQTGYQEYLSPALWESFIKQYPASINNKVAVNEYCQLQTANCQLLSYQTHQQYDIIYFDAFASLHQPEMWDKQAITHTTSFLRPGGVFVTYAITGNLKRLLKSLGFAVQKAPGAPGKREMLRGLKERL